MHSAYTFDFWIKAEFEEPKCNANNCESVSIRWMSIVGFCLVLAHMIKKMLYDSIPGVCSASQFSEDSKERNNPLYREITWLAESEITCIKEWNTWFPKKNSDYRCSKANLRTQWTPNRMNSNFTPFRSKWSWCSGFHSDATVGMIRAIERYHLSCEKLRHPIMNSNSEEELWFEWKQCKWKEEAFF